MSQQVTNGAMMSCSFGVAPATLSVLPKNRVNASNLPAATIMENVPMVNIPAFGMCNSPTNPQVIAATAAASGVFTPQPCIPVIPSPWTPGVPTVMIGGQPALNNTCKLMCMWQGVISISNAGQATVNVP